MRLHLEIESFNKKKVCVGDTQRGIETGRQNMCKHTLHVQATGNMRLSDTTHLHTVSSYISISVTKPDDQGSFESI